jgi:hypothetical protein
MNIKAWYYQYTCYNSEEKCESDNRLTDLHEAYKEMLKFSLNQDNEDTYTLGK